MVRVKEGGLDAYHSVSSRITLSRLNLRIGTYNPTDNEALGRNSRFPHLPFMRLLLLFLAFVSPNSQSASPTYSPNLAKLFAFAR